MSHYYSCKEVEGMLGEKEFIVVSHCDYSECGTCTVTDNAVFSGYSKKQLVKELRKAADEIESSEPDLSSGESYKYKAILNVNGTRVEADIRNHSEVTWLMKELTDEIMEQFYKR